MTEPNIARFIDLIQRGLGEMCCHGACNAALTRGGLHRRVGKRNVAGRVK
ncbi:MAG: hypothetical protein U9N78_06270 [Actinomycetota bacterium]|nr:hypothetical protein [Actinomycetota bacterium]